MATKRMLVDAIHPEETRVVVTSGNRLEEFDFESATRRQLRGNIYLAKVTRVEPSLQAAFVEYGGNRHGFLAFSEIHPDYYQIPVADREAILRDEEAEDAHHDAAADAEPDPSVSEPVDANDGADAEPHEGEDGHGHIEQAPADNEPVESVGGADALEEVPERRRSSSSRRNYKIQEVIKRRQVMLVQVVKEERGNKGAALTTYLSLAGRYSVLMPNTARGGGISRKITNAADRKRLKEITADLEVPQGMGVILRTAGASRTKAEVKRDFEYLMRLWENVRSLTLQSQAPCLVYEEGSLIKRTIRDLYNKDIDEVMVAGDNAFREAKDFMRMIMPSHSKNVLQYREDQPLFSKYGIETQLDQMFSPTVTLPSGGYIVINPTEALVSIDVNSGRATKEHNIEDTALQTNLEAAEEISRQLRLRDLAGLIVIDFIDMMENRSNRAVERKLKDCLRNDRARIQVGRISHFGLMEMSRQRIRFGVVESSTHKCPVCDGTGLVRSVESLALLVMRAVEDHVMRKPGQSINVRVPGEVALYILNTKRQTLSMLEAKYQLSITLVADEHIANGNHYAIERGEARAPQLIEATTHVRVDSAVMDDLEVEDEEVEDEEAEEAVADTVEAAETSEGDGNRRRRRRRRRGGERAEATGQRAAVALDESAEVEDVEGTETEDAEGEETDQPSAAGEREDDEPRKRRRRGRRGGRRNRRPDEGAAPLAVDAEGEVPQGAASDEEAAEPVAQLSAEASQTIAADLLAQDAIAAVADLPPAADQAPAQAAAPAETAGTAEPIEAPAAEDKPKPKRTRRKKADAEAAPAAEGEAPADAAEEKPKARPRTRKPKAAPPTETEAVAAAEAVAEPVDAPAAPEAAQPAVAQADPSVSEAAAPAEAAPEPEAEEAPRRRAKKELPPDEIVVSSTATPKAEDEAEAEKPKRGWWQRRLGLGE